MNDRTLFDPDDAEDRSIQARFERFHRDHPGVYDLFRQFAGEMKRAGHEHYSADAILHRIRWHHDVNPSRHGGFKINDHFVSRYARLLMASDPEFRGFFELRELKTA